MQLTENTNRPVKTICFAVLLLLQVADSYCQVSQDVLKAAYIERITRFVEWPAEKQNGSARPFVIGVISDDYFAAVLREAFKTNRIKGRVVSVKEISGTSGLAGCDMCYLGEKAIKDIQHFIEEANAKGVLLVSHSQNFGRSGIHFNFYIEENQLKFEINEKSIKKGRFSVSHLLMKSSRISG
jgi:hypothetical protein